MVRHSRSSLAALIALLGCAACSPSASATGATSDDEREGEGDVGEESGVEQGMDAGGRVDASSVKDANGIARDADVERRDGGAHRDASTPVSPPRDGGYDAAISDAATPPRPSALLKPKCVSKGSQVLIVGDSYINWPTHLFGPQLAEASKQEWRMLAVGGWSMGSGGLGLIPTQLDGALASDKDFHTIVMDGGGNDVLLADPTIDFGGVCKTPDAPKQAACQTIIDKAIAAARTMLKKASDNGVRDIIYFFYPHVPENTLLGGPNPNKMLDFAMPQVRSFCEGIEQQTGGKTRCHFIDMVPVFQGHPDWFVPGDIHPTPDGSGPMAKKVWETMKQLCVGQTAASDCCEK